MVTTMTSDTALRPFYHELKAIHVAEAGPEGIASSVFQEQDNDCWVYQSTSSAELLPHVKRITMKQRNNHSASHLIHIQTIGPWFQSTVATRQGIQEYKDTALRYRDFSTPWNACQTKVTPATTSHCILYPSQATSNSNLQIFSYTTVMNSASAR